MQVPRIVNFRTFLFSAAAAVAAVLLFVLYYVYPGFSIAGYCGIAAVIAALMIIYRRSVVKIAGMTVTAAVFMLTVLSCVFTAAGYERSVLFKGESAQGYALTGIIEEVYDDGLSKSLLIRPDGDESAGKVMVYLQENRSDEIDTGEFETGDGFSCVATVTALSLIDEEGGVNGYYYRLGVKYRCYVEKGEYSVEKRSFVPYDCYIREIIRSGFRSALGSLYGEIAYGMTVGDKSQLEYGARNAYSVSGIGHILAVSGLHVMFLSWIISWICRRLKLGRKVSFAVNAVVLLLYNVLVGFSASVVRAAIMSVCAQIAGISGERSDSLNNLGFACSVYLAIRPFGLFDAGFVMSVAAVLGIIAFSRPVTAVLTRIFRDKCRKIAQSVALSLSAQIGITPAMIYYFSGLSIYSVLANVVLSYVIMFTFIVLFVSMILSLALPFMQFTAAAAYPGLYIFDVVTAGVQRLPFADYSLFAGAAAFTLYAAYFVMSRFVMKGRFKWIITAVCAVYAISVIALYNVSFEDRSSRIYCYPDEYGQTISVVYDDAGRTALVARLTGKENLFERLKKLKTSFLDEVILLYGDFSVAREMVLLSDRINIGKVYLPFYDAETFALLDSAGIESVVPKNGEKSGMGFAFTIINDGWAATYEHYERILFLPRSLKSGESEKLSQYGFTLVRAPAGQSSSEIKTLFNGAFNIERGEEQPQNASEAYFYDLARDKIEIFD